MPERRNTVAAHRQDAGRVMHIGPVRVAFDGEHSLVESTIEADGRRHEVWFRVSGDRRGDARTTDAFVVLGLIPAMLYAEALIVEGEVSQRLLRTVPAIQSLLADWFPDLVSPVRVTASARRTPAAGPAVVATCFTGGVDSFATLATRGKEIGRLFFVEGFDVPLDQPNALRSVGEHLAAVASDTGTSLEVSTTNAKSFLREYGAWGPLMHGAAIVSSALLAAPGSFEHLVIPSGAQERHLRPWGTHPRLDPLWSTEYLEVEHDAAQLNRMEKLGLLRDNPTAQRHLRVCHRADGRYNCGECYKCLRTMVTLDIEDALADFPTFPSTLDIDAVRRLPPRNATERRYMQWNLQLARARSGKADLADALSVALRADDGVG